MSEEKKVLVRPHVDWLAGIGKGWHSIVQSLIDDANAEPDCQILQVKEKFGGLRFYTSGASPKLNKLIEAAEEASNSICEFCGNPGEHKDIGHWIKTSCETCLTQQKQIREERRQGRA